MLLNCHAPRSSISRRCRCRAIRKERKKERKEENEHLRNNVGLLCHAIVASCVVHVRVIMIISLSYNKIRVRFAAPFSFSSSSSIPFSRSFFNFFYPFAEFFDVSSKGKGNRRQRPRQRRLHHHSATHHHLIAASASF